MAALGWTAKSAILNKTQANDASVETFLAGIEPDGRRADAAALAALMARVSGEPARMWGPSIIGFGVRRYRHETGRKREICQVGFSPRKGAFALYVTGQAENNPKVAALGKVTTGKGCIYVKKLANIELSRLEALVAESFPQA
ncbi:MAG TPA: DUF1801 domain-containing protein [Caulobacteraceae bacterium]|jgi:hypothetical protein|nr:DUF1801 domain-containing protein [Caulobacteraceae bacterium]